jgi:hypothetical protein
VLEEGIKVRDLKIISLSKKVNEFKEVTERLIADKLEMVGNDKKLWESIREINIVNSNNMDELNSKYLELLDEYSRDKDKFLDIDRVNHILTEKNKRLESTLQMFQFSGEHVRHEGNIQGTPGPNLQRADRGADSDFLIKCGSAQVLIGDDGIDRIYSDDPNAKGQYRETYDDLEGRNGSDAIWGALMSRINDIKGL